MSSEEQREILGLLCKVHELEIENAEMQSHALLKDNLIRQKNFVVQRFEQHRHLCDEIIQQQRRFIDGEFVSFLISKFIWMKLFVVLVLSQIRLAAAILFIS